MDEPAARQAPATGSGSAAEHLPATEASPATGGGPAADAGSGGPGADLGTVSDRVVAVMATLRRRCPWSSRQDHRSLEKYAREETEELIEALEDHLADPTEAHRDAVLDELGDVFYQVLFHSALLDESDAAPYGHTLAAIVDRLEQKLIRRHPLAFGPDADDGGTSDLEAVEAEYHRIKAEEKRQAAERERGDAHP